MRIVFGIVFLALASIVHGQDTIWLQDNSQIVGKIIELKETSLTYQINDTSKQKIALKEVVLVKMSNGETFAPAEMQEKLEEAYKNKYKQPKKPFISNPYSNELSINYLSLLRRTVNFSYEHRVWNNQLGFRIPVYMGYPLLKRENQFAVKKFSTGLDVLYYTKSSVNVWLYFGLGFEVGEYYDIYDEALTLFGGFNPPVNYNSIDDVATAQFWSGLMCMGVTGKLSESFYINMGMDLGIKYVYNRRNVKDFAELSDRTFGFFGGEIPSSFLVNSFNPAGRLQFGIGYNF